MRAWDREHYTCPLDLHSNQISDTDTHTGLVFGRLRGLEEVECSKARLQKEADALVGVGGQITQSPAGRGRLASVRSVALVPPDATETLQDHPNNGTPSVSYRSNQFLSVLSL